jgi:hypothetical protein
MKLLCRIAAVVALCGLRFGAASAANEWRDATVEMSDGETITAQVAFPQDMFYMYNEAAKRRLTVRIGEVKAIETLIEKESMEKKWFFKEDGRDEKVYTTETWPVRYFLTRAVFADGQALDGTIVGQAFFVKTEDGVRNYMLTRKMEGKVGQKLEDVVYVKRISLAGAAGGTLGEIGGVVRLPPGERLVQVMVLHCDKDTCVPARVQGERFTLGRCMAGAHDLVVSSDKALYYASSAEKGEPPRRMDAATLKEIEEWAKKVREFFHDQTPLYGAGDGKRAYVLVRLERHGGTSMAGAELVRRYEVWLMSKPAEEWQITKRFYIQRLNSKQKEVPFERIAIAPALAGHVITPDKPRLDLLLDLSSVR